MIKTMSLFVAGVALSASPLYAGTMGPIASHYNWTGITIGAQVGGGHDTINWDFYNDLNTERFKQARSIGKYGAQVGYQYQWNNVVIGLEGAYIRNFSNDGMLSISTINTDRSRLSRNNNLWLVTPRLGLAYDRWLGYVKGGYANSTVDFESFVVSTGGETSTSSGNNSGWVVGVGADYALLNNLTLGLEYDYVNLNVNNRYQTVSPGFFVTGAKPVTHVYANSNLVMVRANYKFNLA